MIDLYDVQPVKSLAPPPLTAQTRDGIVIWGNGKNLMAIQMAPPRRYLNFQVMGPKWLEFGTFWESNIEKKNPLTGP